jgi:autophagy-related protein 18
MLYSTSLLAVVGAGAQPALSPRRLSVLNTAEQARLAHATHCALHAARTCALSVR